MSTVSVPQLGQPAPAFTAAATRGSVRFPSDYQGRWVVLLSHPGAFDPLGAAELGAFAGLAPQFAARSCTLLAFSPDSLEAHVAWTRQLGQSVPEGADAVAPIASDDGGAIARAYGLVPAEPSAARPARGVFIIDPQSRVRVALLYPREIARDAAHILWLVTVLQQSENTAAQESLAVRQQPLEEQAQRMPAEETAPVEQNVFSVPVMPAEQNAPVAPVTPITPVAPDAPVGQAGRQHAVYPVVEAEPNARRAGGHGRQHDARTAAAVPNNATAARETADVPAANQPLRPVSQSVWDALAQARPYSAEEQPGAPVPHRAETSAGRTVRPSSDTAVGTARSQQHARSSASAVPQQRQTGKPAKPGAQAPSGAASIAEQNRLLLGGLLDKETAENGGGEDGADYMILRDFPFQH